MSRPVGRTDDGRHIVVGGRRWRATDPSIPERFRKELVSELMAARRAVKASQTNPDELEVARQRVNRAKVALGERGEPWWEQATDDALATRARAAALALLNKRGPESSVCPSEVARIVSSPTWRPAMDDVRRTMKDLRDEGLIRITQGDATVDDLDAVRGPIRLRLPQAVVCPTSG